MKALSKVTVAVPASTSNLGPGFDCLGLALGLYNELALSLYDERGDPSIEIEGEGAATLPRDRANVMVRAAETVLAGRHEGRRLVFKARNRIPLARGLGSSAAAVLAGVCAANRLLGDPLLGDDELLEYAATIEGHPDNAAASFRGGLVLSVKRHKKFETIGLPLHKDVSAVVCVPRFELPTSKAREVLPHTVLREQAVANIARGMLLATALGSGSLERLSLAMEDELHQPYRAGLVPGLRDVITAAVAAGAAGAALSGAGPSVVALHSKKADAKRIGDAMAAAFERKGVAAKSIPLPIDRKGVLLIK